MPNTVTVTHKATGRSWTVPAFTSRPNNRYRVAYRAASVEDVDGLLPCAGCGNLTGATDTTYRGIVVAVGQADRIVNDLDAFEVTGEVAYGLATTVNVCPAHNGSKRRDGVHNALEAAALARLEAHAEPCP